MQKPITIKTIQRGKTELRLVRQGSTIFGLANGKIICQGTDEAAVLKNLQDDAGKTTSGYFGFDGARKKFLHFFPGGFQSDGYGGHEREYKLESKRKLEAIASPEEAANATGLGAEVWRVYQTNMLFPNEKMRVRDILFSPRADAFVQAAAKFTLSGSKHDLVSMAMEAKPFDAAKWTVVTLLPFLWRPERHMFLKPEVTKQFAERVGHPFSDVYSPKLDIDVYDCLLDLAAKTEMALKDLDPRDRIDIQSFIWVIGAYDEEAPTP